MDTDKKMRDSKKLIHLHFDRNFTPHESLKIPLSIESSNKYPIRL